MSAELKVAGYLPARHPASCAVHDPSPGYCDCGAQQTPLVTLANAKAAVAAAKANLANLNDPAVQMRLAAQWGFTKAEPVPPEKSGWCEYVAGIVEHWVGTEECASMNDDADRRTKAIAGIIGRRLWALKQAEPVPSHSEWMDVLDSAIMNIPHKPENYSVMGFNQKLGYKMGHRDARHAAVEKVLAMLPLLPTQAEPVRVPEGFALVPIEPTPEMLDAAVQAICYGKPGGFTRSDGPWRCWSAMLTAAQAKRGAASTSGWIADAASQPDRLDWSDADAAQAKAQEGR